MLHAKIRPKFKAIGVKADSGIDGGEIYFKLQTSHPARC
jgi:hypothetical protein